MRLKVLVPTEVILERQVVKVIAEGADGVFCMLPRHIDCVSALVPGILTFTDELDDEQYVAVDQGILVKCGDEILVSTYSAIHSEDLEELREAVERQFLELEEQERKTRTAVARLEADLVRRFYEMGKYGRR